MFKSRINNEIKEHNTLLEAKMDALLSFKKDNNIKLVEVLDDNDEIVFSKLREAFVGKITNVEELPGFKDARTELGLSDDDIEEIKNKIIENPNVGDTIKDTNGARKVRIALTNNNKGKRGGARVVYVNIYVDETAYLIMIFSKSSQADLTFVEKKLVRNIVDFLKKK